MRTLLLAASAAITIGATIPADASSITFSFDSLTPGTGTPITLTVDGLSATLTAAGDPGGFQIVGAGMFSFPGQDIFTPGTSGQQNEALDIAFSEPLTSFSGNFATDGPGPLDLTARLGGSEVGTSSVTGTTPSGFSFPEGLIGFSGAKFNAIVLADSTDPNFAFGSFTVTTASVPEPATWALVLAGFAGIGLLAGGRASRTRATLAA